MRLDAFQLWGYNRWKGVPINKDDAKVHPHQIIVDLGLITINLFLKFNLIVDKGLMGLKVGSIGV